MLVCWEPAHRMTDRRPAASALAPAARPLRGVAHRVLELVPAVRVAALPLLARVGLDRAPIAAAILRIAGQAVAIAVDRHVLIVLVAATGDISSEMIPKI